MQAVRCLSFLLAGPLFAHHSPAPQHAPSPPSQAPAPSPSPSSPAGHWEGVVGLPTTQLDVRVDLEENAPGVGSGSIEETLAPEVLEAVSDWLAQTLRR